MSILPFTLISYLTLFIRTIIVISSTNWIILWTGLELNILSFIPLINTTNQYQETEARVKYFLVQALGSRLLLFARISSYMSSNLHIFIITVLLTSLILKLGMFPLHYWYPSVITSISWISALTLTSWQKLAPLIIIRFYFTNNLTTILITLSTLNAIIGGVLGLNQVHIRAILSYSSITHIGWIISLIRIEYPVPAITYFIFYVVIISPIFLQINKINLTSSTHIKTFNTNTSYIILPILILSLGGLPPLLGFVPKLLTIIILSCTSISVLIILILGSLINLYFYLNILFSLITGLTTNYTPITTKINLLSYGSVFISLLLPVLII